MLIRQTFTQHDPSLKRILIKVDLFCDPSLEKIAEDLMVEVMDSIEKYRLAGAFGVFEDAKED